MEKIPEYANIDCSSDHGRRAKRIVQNSMRQYALRIIFYQPILFMKSLDKVSLKDLVLSDDFTIEDAVLFYQLFFRILDFGLLWFKDSVLEALAMANHPNSSGVAASDLGEPGKPNKFCIN